MTCEHVSRVKWGTYVNKSGVFQKYKCKDCGSTVIGEELKKRIIDPDSGRSYLIRERKEIEK